MNIRLQVPKVTDLRPRIRVIGVGGAGCNAVNNMIASGLSGVDFVVANTDAQSLAASTAENRLQLGVNLTEGLGAGSKPEIGEAAAEEAIEDIRAQITGSHMVFIAAGMGGGTGTGAAGVIARVARELGALTVGIVTKPFHFEGVRRMRVAEVGIAELRKHVDTLIVIPNQNLFRVANEKTTFAEAFVRADQVLYSGIACIVDLIVKEGLINLDFADVRTIMSGMGTAVMGTGDASGPGRAIAAAEAAIANPLLDDVSLRGAKGLLLSIIGGRDLTLYEVDSAATRVRQEIDPEANIIVGATFDESLGDRMRVSIVASGLANEPDQRPQPGAASGAARPPADPQLAHRPRPGASSPEEFMHALSSTTDDKAVPSPDNQYRPREVWRGPGDVYIEEGIARPIAGSPAPFLPAQQSAPEECRPVPFVPAPAVEARGDAWRMPEVDDFPVVGQREYRAKAGRTSPPAEQASSEPASAARKPGLLQRLTGFGRRGESPPLPQRTSFVPAQGPASPGLPSPSQRRPAYQPYGTPSQTQEQADLPTFFTRGRKGS
jgi:cell division protein FtsZ